MFVCFRSYLLVRAPFAQTLKKGARQGKVVRSLIIEI